MKFVLITKFAVSFAPENPRRRYEDRGNWPDYRIGLFKKYTLPSVKAQTFKEFDWIFLVSPGFKGLRQDHVDELSKYGKVEYVESPWDCKYPEAGKILQKNYSGWVCSMRLDSDDIIRNDYIEGINAIAIEKEFVCMYRYGYMLKDDKVALRDYIDNPFVCHVENSENGFKSAYDVDHIRMSKYCERFNIARNNIQIPGWIQVDHGDNIKNLARKKFGSMWRNDSFSADKIKQDFTWEW